MKIVYAFILFFLFISCSKNENFVISNNGTVSISPYPQLNLDKETNTASITIAPSKGWKLVNAVSVIGKDTTNLKIVSSIKDSYFFTFSDWCEIEKCTNDTIITVKVQENIINAPREMILYLSYCGINSFYYTIIQKN